MSWLFVNTCYSILNYFKTFTHLQILVRPSKGTLDLSVHSLTCSDLLVICPQLNMFIKRLIEKCIQFYQKMKDRVIQVACSFLKAVDNLQTISLSKQLEVPHGTVTGDSAVWSVSIYSDPECILWTVWIICSSSSARGKG